jgi:hypothetical protein
MVPAGKLRVVLPLGRGFMGSRGLPGEGFKGQRRYREALRERKEV